MCIVVYAVELTVASHIATNDYLESSQEHHFCFWFRENDFA